MKTRLSKIFAGLLAAIYLSSMAFTGAVFAIPQRRNAAQFPLVKQGPKRGINPETGKVSFIGGGDPINVPAVSTSSVLTLPGRAMNIMNTYGAEFGLKNPSQELKLLRSEKDDTGNDLVHYQQVYNGVPILSGEMIVNMNSNGQLLSISGEVSSDLALDTNPAITAQDAGKTALAEIAKLHQLNEAQFTASSPELWIFDESLLTASTRPAELVWRMEVSAKDVSQPVREMVLVNAQTGAMSFHINEIDTEFAQRDASNTVSPNQGNLPQAVSSRIQYADLVVDQARSRLYGADKAGNKIDIINIADLSIIGAYVLAAGAAPTGVDLSPSGNELAIAQSGLNQVKFINLVSGAVSQLSAPLRGGPNGETSLATDVVYGRSGILYVLSSNGLHVVNLTVTPHVEDTAQYVAGEPGLYDERFGAISSDKNTLYYLTDNSALTGAEKGLDKYNVSSGLASPVLLNQTHLLGTENENGFRLGLIDNTAILLTSGAVYNASNLTPKAKNGQSLSPALAIPSHNFYVAGFNNPSGTDLLYFYDTQSSYLTSVLNTGLTGTLGAMAVIGNGSTLFVSSTGGMAKFTLGTTAPGAAASLPVSMKQYADFAFDMPRGVIYGTDASNRIDVISQSTGNVTNSYLLPNGSNPKGIDLSPDGSELAIALNGLEKILFINPTTGAHIAEVTPQLPDGTNYVNMPFDVIYGRTGRLYSDGDPNGLDSGTSGSDYVHVIDTTTHSWVVKTSYPDVLTSGTEFALTSDKRYLYANEPNGSLDLYGFDVQTDTVTKPYQSLPVGDASQFTISPDGSKVFTANGQVWSGNLQTRLGTLQGAPTVVPLGALGCVIKYIPGKNAVAITVDNTIKFISAIDYHLISTYVSPYTGTILEMEVAPDGSKLIANDQNGVVSVISLATFPPVSPATPTPLPTFTPGGSSTINRKTYTASGSFSTPGSLLCDQTKTVCTNGADPDADNAHRYAADTFNFYKTHHGRNSFDNRGSTIISTVRYGIGYQNAFWDGYQMVYGDGMAADDVVAHELTHAVTQYSSNLIYAYQSGAINESFSDIWGEFVDQTNGSGNDSPSVKWLLGEDTPLGAIRSMSDPTIFGDPDKMSSPYYYNGLNDNGGVHINSGVNNKAAFLMTDGGTFNGRTITGIGLNKVAAVYYEVQVHLLTSGANYNDLYYALIQACQNLMGGTSGIVQSDCNQVKAAAEAVEMLPPPPPPTSTPTSTPVNTPTATPAYSHNPLYLSLANSQTIGGVSAANEDILKFDGTNWSLYFKGGKVGLGSVNLAAFHIVNANTILVAFNANVTINGIAATPHDILRFDATSLGSNTAGTFSMYFHGSDVGLTTTSENIDALSLLPDGRLLISTNGNPSVPGVTSAQDEDVLAFTPTSLGSTTSGTWSLYFDGTSVGLGDTSGEDVDALDVVGNNIYLSTVGNFSVPGLSGAKEDVFVCVATSLGSATACNYSPTLYFQGSTWGLSANNVDGFQFLASGPVATPTNTPTRTATSTPTSAPGATSTPTRTPSPTATFTRTPTATTGPSPTSTPTATRTVTAGASTTLTFTTVADARVSEASPTTNYGTSTYLQADASTGAGLKSYIRFTTSGISGTIQSVKLRVYCTTNSTANGPATYLADSNWTESGTGGITWNTQPTLLSSGFDNKGAIATASWVEYDVTSLVTGNGTYTFALIADSNDGVTFSSREGTNPPQLVVTFGP